MSVENLKFLMIGVLVFGFSSEKILGYLNVRNPVPNVPQTLENHLDRKKLEETKAYQLENFRLNFFEQGLGFLLTLIFILQGWFGDIDTWISSFGYGPLVSTLLFFGLVIGLSSIPNIPFDWYQTFVIEEKYGFNKMTVRTFILDKLKGFALGALVGGALMLVFFWLILRMGSDFWWQFWLIAAGFMVLANLFYTSWILPLFNKLTPLENGELREKILQYARSVDFPLDNVFVMDGSKRSAKANAFFSGMGKRKKVVLYDTLIEQHSTDELVAVLAHEVGHFKKKHIVWGMVISVLQTGLMLFLLGGFIFSENISLALGGNSWSVGLNFIGFSLLISPISTVLGLVMNWLSRKNEFEADEYAKLTFDGKPLAEALKTLSVKTLSNINPHPWYVFVNYSHPPLLERLEKLES
ncbi:M48 family metallopeptidase [Algoriphagus sp. A40]|uniref:M48 family metallopeptidase n=1 Tax=Algoriphagus sp. A40 TaxID=1945863 RepID=UPI000984C5AC|nr:M48 family metallopeptidase [Algoriphagus sp. A40]OOG75301.1 peptidase M48 [Algoriphagus sp. A40]